MQQTQELAPHIQEIARALANRVDMEQIEDELSRYLEYGVPLAQAKRDIVRNHGGTLKGGAKKVKDLAPGDQGVDLLVKVLTVNPKEITVKGEKKTIYYGFLADETAKVPYTAWKDHGFERGRSYAIANVYAKQGFREGIEVNVGDYARVGPAETDVEVPDAIDAPTGGGGGLGAPRVAGGEMAIKDLRDGVSSATVTARVLDAREKTITGANGTRALIEGELADATGKVAFTAWSPEAHGQLLKNDAVVRIANAYVKAWRGVPNLNFGDNAQVEVMPADALPRASDLNVPTRFSIGELEKIGGGTDVQVEGVVLEVKKGSGLIQRCPQCNRVLQKRECRLHGKVEGTADLRVKAVLDDGTAAVTFFLGREGTERLLGKTLPQCQEMAKEAMTMDVIQDDLVAVLTARTLLVQGNATSDDFGLQIIASDATFPPAKDPVEEAARLLDEVQDFLPREVA